MSPTPLILGMPPEAAEHDCIAGDPGIAAVVNVWPFQDSDGATVHRLAIHLRTGLDEPTLAGVRDVVGDLLTAAARGEWDPNIWDYLSDLGMQAYVRHWADGMPP
jgi:hypothetical protein